MRLSARELGAALSIVFALVIEGQAGLILQDFSMMGRVFSPDEYGFAGQSFTAEDPLIASIGIGVRIASPQFAERSITMSLYAGSGNQGALLGTVTVTPPAGGDSPQWVDFAFPGVVFTPGSVYTFTCLENSFYWFAEMNQYAYPNGTPLNGFDYTGGQFFDRQGFMPLQDMRFRVVPVPEPGVCWIAGAGIGLLWLARLKRIGQ